MQNHARPAALGELNKVRSKDLICLKPKVQRRPSAQLKDQAALLFEKLVRCGVLDRFPIDPSRRLVRKTVDQNKVRASSPASNLEARFPWRLANIPDFSRGVDKQVICVQASKIIDWYRTKVPAGTGFKSGWIDCRSVPLLPAQYKRVRQQALELNVVCRPTLLHTRESYSISDLLPSTFGVDFGQAV